MKKTAASIGLLVTAAGLFAAGCMGAPAGMTESESQGPSADIGQSADELDEAPDCQRRGMTWVWKSRTVDVDSVGSDAATNPYIGNTTCNTSLPLLCIRKPSPGLPVPPYIDNTNIDNKWSGGVIALTREHLGYDMTSRAAADSICAGELGTGWRMAEFHDGAGWNFQAYGAATHPERFWAAINDQNANCWNSACQ